jgi:hypothetical protein
MLLPRHQWKSVPTREEIGLPVDKVKVIMVSCIEHSSVVRLVVQFLPGHVAPWSCCTQMQLCSCCCCCSEPAIGSAVCLQVVYACSNQCYKLDPATLTTWTNILRRVPHSVLWLLRFPPAGEPHVRSEVAARGVDPSRVIFTDVAPKEVRCGGGEGKEGALIPGSLLRR